MDRARADCWAALERADRRAAARAVRRLRAQGLDALQVVSEVLLPAQRRIGELWERGAWSIEQEHAATSVTEGLVHALCAQADPPPTDAPLVVVACLVGERHALPALVVAEGLHAAGIQVNYLGADPDPGALVAQVLALKPRAVVLSGSLTSSLARQRRTFETLAAIGTPVLVGGSAFGHDARRALAIGASAHVDDLDTLVGLVRALPQRSASRPVGEATPAQVEADWLLARLDDLTAYVVAGLAARRGDAAATSGRGWWETLATHVDHVLGCLASTLVTDDETIMVEVGQWLDRVLVARGAPSVLVGELWEVLTEVLRGHPLARLQLAGAVPVVASGRTPADTGRPGVEEPRPAAGPGAARRVAHGSDGELGASA